MLKYKEIFDYPQISEHNLCCSTVKQRLVQDLSNKREAFDIDSRAKRFDNLHQDVHHYVGAEESRQVVFIEFLFD